MRAKDVMGKRIVAVHQVRRPNGRGQTIVDVVHLELEDGTRLAPVTIETETGEYGHAFRVDKPRAALRPDACAREFCGHAEKTHDWGYLCRARGCACTRYENPKQECQVCHKLVVIQALDIVQWDGRTMQACSTCQRDRWKAERDGGGGSTL